MTFGHVPFLEEAQAWVPVVMTPAAGDVIAKHVHSKLASDCSDRDLRSDELKVKESTCPCDGPLVRGMGRFCHSSLAVFTHGAARVVLRTRHRARTPEQQGENGLVLASVPCDETHGQPRAALWLAELLVPAFLVVEDKRCSCAGAGRGRCHRSAWPFRDQRSEVTRHREPRCRRDSIGFCSHRESHSMTAARLLADMARNLDSRRTLAPDVQSPQGSHADLQRARELVREDASEIFEAALILSPKADGRMAVRVLGLAAIAQQSKSTRTRPKIPCVHSRLLEAPPSSCSVALPGSLTLSGRASRSAGVRQSVAAASSNRCFSVSPGNLPGNVSCSF